MSLLDNASLLLTPNAYKEGKLYSVIPSNGNGDFTATRATTATRVNSSGLVDLVPYNLVQQSEMFSQAIWTKSATTLTANTTTAPDGTLTADTLIENTANSSHQVFQSVTSVNGATAYTATIYVKQNTNRNVALRVQDGAFTHGQAIVTYNLNTGVLISQTVSGNGVIVSTSATLVNGFYRIQLTFTINLSTSFRTDILIVNGSSNSYLGDGTSNIIIWGAQLVEGTSARDYLRTETRLNIPRIDYSLGGCPNILLEPQRTNLALQSSSFDNASWSKFGSSVTANSTTSPSGISDADTLIESATNATHLLEQSVAVTAVNHTLSCYVKAVSGSTRNVGILFNTTLKGVLLNPSTGAVVTYFNTTAADVSISNVGNGWFRVSVTALTAAITEKIRIYLGNGTTWTAPYLGDGTSGVYIWGAQLEAGAYATSYIPTTTASVTRNADSITRNNIFTNGLITASGGTWFVELRNVRTITRDSFVQAVGIGNALPPSVTNGFYLSNAGGSLTPTFRKNISTTETSLLSLATGTVKLAVKWNGSTMDVFQNGVKVVNATAFAITNMEFLFGYGNDVPKFINEMALFPTPLTDAQCLALTA